MVAKWKYRSVCAFVRVNTCMQMGMTGRTNMTCLRKKNYTLGFEEQGGFTSIIQKLMYNKVDKSHIR